MKIFIEFLKIVRFLSNNVNTRRIKQNRIFLLKCKLAARSYQKDNISETCVTAITLFVKIFCWHRLFNCFLGFYLSLITFKFKTCLKRVLRMQILIKTLFILFTSQHCTCSHSISHSMVTDLRHVVFSLGWRGTKTWNSTKSVLCRGTLGENSKLQQCSHFIASPCLRLPPRGAKIPHDTH
jgi:hypothetical protein